MSRPKKRLVVKRAPTNSDASTRPNYIVIKAVNLLDPKVGDVLSENTLQEEINRGTNVEVVS